ncbi:MAG TPA: hypothetical protein VIW69_11670 [Candidatus Elarobacter sp.]
MDFLIGALFAAFLIVVSTVAGRSLDRAKLRAADEIRAHDSEHFGEF